MGTNSIDLDTDPWSAVLAGDHAAFAVIFDRHHARVFRHVVGVLGSGGDADDVTAATFLELWRKRADVRVVHNSVLPWLLVTAGYLARNNGRRTKRYQTLLQQLPRDERSIDAAEEAERKLEESHRSKRVGIAMNTLRPVDAQLIALTALGGYSIIQASDVLGLTPGAARVRLHRARQKLRGQLNNLVESNEEGE